MHEPLPLVFLTSDDRTAQQAVRRGELVRVTRGIAVEARAWQEASVRERRRVELEAVMTTLGEWRVLSHRSAALLWGLPDVDRPDRRVHVTDPLLGTTHSGRRVVRHAATLEGDEVTDVDGRRVTTLLRTVVDVVRSTSYENGVTVLDHVLHEDLLGVDEVRRAFAAWPTPCGMTRARRALRFADARAESPGESVSRVRIDEDGFPPPVLQQAFGRFRVDFWWPRAGIVGEFDGFEKYDGTEAFRREKTREQELLLRPEVPSGRALGVVGGAHAGTFADRVAQGGPPDRRVTRAPRNATCAAARSVAPLRASAEVAFRGPSTGTAAPPP